MGVRAETWDLEMDQRSKGICVWLEHGTDPHRRIDETGWALRVPPADDNLSGV